MRDKCAKQKTLSVIMFSQSDVQVQSLAHSYQGTSSPVMISPGNINRARAIVLYGEQRVGSARAQFRMFVSLPLERGGREN